MAAPGCLQRAGWRGSRSSDSTAGDEQQTSPADSPAVQYLSNTRHKYTISRSRRSKMQRVCSSCYTKML